MASDTFAEVVEWMENLSNWAPTLGLSPAVVVRATQAARLLAAAGEEVRAGRKLKAKRDYYSRIKDPKVAECGPYEILPLMEAEAAAVKALDQLAPELKEIA